MMSTATIVAFIAGYAIVSFLVQKVKDARDRSPDQRKNDDSDVNARRF